MEKGRSGKTFFARTWFLMMIPGMLWMITGCAKDGGVCLSSTGQIIRQTRIVPDFNRMDIADYVNIILSTDSTNRIIVETGQNIITGITTEVIDGQLFIRNNNKCNWLRDYSAIINVYVWNKKLWNINYNGSGNISSAGTLKLDSISLIVWGGCGTIDLALDVWQGVFDLNMGTTDFRLHGVCAITSVYSGDYGLYDARDLKTGYTFITNKGTNDCYVQAVNGLEATIHSIGNIYYRGEPKSIKATILGPGKLLPL